MIIPAMEDALESVVRLGLVSAFPVDVSGGGVALMEEIAWTCDDLEQGLSGRSPSSIAGLGPARDLYRAFGIDPTRHRPSSEALLRRILKGKGFPRILDAVDLCNLFALRFMLSLGLYDTDKIAGQVVLRRGRADESYPGIRKNEVHLEGRPLLADDRGPFGNPTSDSLRTSLTPGTKSVWMVIFAPAGYSAPKLSEHTRSACADVARFLAPEGKETHVEGRLHPGPGDPLE